MSKCRYRYSRCGPDWIPVLLVPYFGIMSTSRWDLVQLGSIRFEIEHSQIIFPDFT